MAATFGESDGCRHLVGVSESVCRVRPEHVGSMATTTTNDILMVYGDGAEGVFET